MKIKEWFNARWEQYQRYRRQQAEHQALLAMDQRQLRDIGLIGRGDIAAVVDGTFFSDPTRRQRRTRDTNPVVDLSWINRDRPRPPTTGLHRCA